MGVSRVLCALVILGSVSLAEAQQPEPLTYVALFRVEPAATDGFITEARKYIPTMDKLVASGAIVAYGLEVDYLHNTANQNVAFWYTAMNYAGLQKADEAIEAFQKASPEVVKATSQLTDMSKHSDLIVRSLVHNWSKNPGCATPLTSFAMYKVKPGKMAQFIDAFKTQRQAIYDDLVKQGAVCSYAIDVEDYHTMAPGQVWVLMATPDLAAGDKVDAALEAAAAKLTASERESRQRMMEEIVVEGSHRDSLTQTVFSGSK